MYYFATKLKGDFAEVEQKLIAALKEEGFGILTEIDIQKTMKAKLDADYPPYKILGACNPPLAHQALQAEDDMGLLLPCNVVIRQTEDGDIVVSFMDPEAVFTLVESAEGIEEVTQTARQKLQNVMAALEGEIIAY